MRFIVHEILKQNESYVFSVENFISQYEFQKRAMTRADNKRDTVIVPDGLLQLGKTIIRFEVERMNSLKEFSNKMRGYKDQFFYLNKAGFCPFFHKENTHKLFILAPDNKIISYKHILADEKIAEYYQLQIIREEKILGNL